MSISKTSEAGGALSRRPGRERGSVSGERIPVNVITGFLGSGKTTILNTVLRRPEARRAMVIVNEFGEAGLDHLLVARPKEDVVLLASGCLCCSVRGDLVETLASLHAERERGEIAAFDRVVVETTGLAEPAPVLASVADEDLAEQYSLRSVVTTVDSVHGLAQLADHPVSVNQICVADRIALTKADLASPHAMDTLRQTVSRLNPYADIFQATNGQIDPEAVLGGADTGEALASRFDGSGGASVWGDAAARPGTPGHIHDDVTSFTIRLNKPVTAAGLELWLNLLATFKGPDLLRVKGLMNLDGRPVVLQLVQHLFHPLVELPDWPDKDHTSRLVFITRGLSREAIEPSLSALRFASAPRGKGLIDAQAYDRFKQIVGRIN